MTLPSPKLTVEGIGTKGVAEAAGSDLLALVFLPEGSPGGGLVVERRILFFLLNSSRNMCFNLRQTLKLSIASPQNNQFGWRIFLQSVTKDRNTSTYLIQVVRSIFQTFSYYHIKPYYGRPSCSKLIPRVSKPSPKPGKIAG